MWSELRAGDSISQAECQKLIGSKPTEAIYGLGLLQLKQQIELELYAEGYNFAIVCCKGGLRVLDHHEVAKWAESNLKRAFRIINVTNSKLSDVDTTGLTELEKSKHVKASRRSSAYLAGLASSRRSQLSG